MYSVAFRWLVVATLSFATADVCGAQADRQLDCRKNVLIYVDGSKSMFDSDGTTTPMAGILSFLGQAIRSRHLITDGDHLVVQRFAAEVSALTAAFPRGTVNSDIRAQLVERVDRLRVSPEQIQIRRQNNDYLKLMAQIARDVEAAPARRDAANFVVVFSDFFYNPEVGGRKRTAEELEEHRAGIRAAMESLDATIAGRGFRMLLVYQANPDAEGYGVDVFDDFASSGLARSITRSGESIDDLVTEFEAAFSGVKLTSPDQLLRFGGGALKAALEVRNQACHPITVDSVTVGPATLVAAEVDGSRTLTASTWMEADVDVDGAGSASVEFVLPVPQTAAELVGSEWADNEYEVLATARIGEMPFEARLRLRLSEESFRDEFRTRAVQLHFVDHVTPWFDQLYLTVWPEGSLLDVTELTVMVEHVLFKFDSLSGPEGLGDRPIDGKTGLTFVFRVLEADGLSLDDVKEKGRAREELRVSTILARSASTEFPLSNPRREFSVALQEAKFTDWRLLEALVFVVLFLLAFAVRIPWSTVLDYERQ